MEKYQMQFEISSQNDMDLFTEIVVIPSCLQMEILQEHDFSKSMVDLEMMLCLPTDEPDDFSEKEV